MAKSHNQKIKILILEEILRDTDAAKVVTMQEILDRLGQYGISAERKSIYDDMEALRDFGYDIQYKRGRTGGYYLNSGVEKRETERRRKAKVQVQHQIQRRETAVVQNIIRSRRLRRGESAGRNSATPARI